MVRVDGSPHTFQKKNFAPLHGHITLKTIFAEDRFCGPKAANALRENLMRLKSCVPRRQHSMVDTACRNLALFSTGQKLDEAQCASVLRLDTLLRQINIVVDLPVTVGPEGHMLHALQLAVQQGILRDDDVESFPEYAILLGARSVTCEALIAVMNGFSPAHAACLYADEGRAEFAQMCDLARTCEPAKRNLLIDHLRQSMTAGSATSTGDAAWDCLVETLANGLQSLSIRGHRGPHFVAVMQRAFALYTSARKVSPENVLAANSTV